MIFFFYTVLFVYYGSRQTYLFPGSFTSLQYYDGFQIIKMTKKKKRRLRPYILAYKLIYLSYTKYVIIRNNDKKKKIEIKCFVFGEKTN